MDIAGIGFRLVGTLPVVAVMAVGVWLAFQHRWKHPRGCTLLMMSLILAMTVYVVLPVISQVVMHLLINQLELGSGQWRVISFVQTFIFSMAWAVVWGLILYAVFGRDGLLQPRPESDEDYN